jgi:SAM-dependent methyltransferase
MIKRELLLKFLNNKLVQSIIYSPLLDHHQWETLTFVKQSAKSISPKQSILDLGAGELRYKKYFEHCVYKSQDLCVGDDEWYFKNIDIKSSIYDVPVDSNSYDFILCTQVLEHLEFPEKAFAEFNRILKPGGKVFLTVPLGQGEHQVPHDYFRYTRYGLKSLGNRNELELIYIKSQGGIFINLEYILWQSISYLLPFNNIALIRYIYFIILIPVKILSGILFIILDVFDRKKIYTNNYNCIYQKIEK